MEDIPNTRTASEGWQLYVPGAEVSEEVPCAEVSEEVPGARLSKEVPSAGVSEDVPLAEVSEEVPSAGISEDLFERRVRLLFGASAPEINALNYNLYTLLHFFYVQSVKLCIVHYDNEGILFL